jgi:hypothetical protein
MIKLRFEKNFCSGSLADLRSRMRSVRFTLKSRHAHRRHQCLLSAMSGHDHFGGIYSEPRRIM